MERTEQMKQTEKKQLRMVLDGGVTLIGEVRDEDETALYNVGMVSVVGGVLPTGQVVRQAMIVGLGGFSEGPIGKVSGTVPQTRTARVWWDVTQENVGAGAYKRIVAAYEEFLQGREQDEQEEGRSWESGSGRPREESPIALPSGLVLPSGLGGWGGTTDSCP